MNFKILCALFLACYPQFAQSLPSGGHEIGNGGDVVKCKDGDKVTLEILDVFEAREVRGLGFPVDTDQDNPIQLAKSWLARLTDLDSVRASYFTYKVEHFMEDMMLLEARDFPDIQDAKTFPLPKNCTMLQIAIQAPKKYSFDREYFINADLWNVLPVAQQAALILHEVVYNEMLRRGHKTSDAARYYSSLLFSGKIKELTQDSYDNMVAYLNMDRIFWHDAEKHVSWLLSEEQFFESEKARQHCERLHMKLVYLELPEFAKKIEGLMHSYVGTYYFAYANNPTAVWIDDDEGRRSRILVFKYRSAEVVVNPDQNISRRALCYAEG